MLEVMARAKQRKGTNNPQRSGTEKRSGPERTWSIGELGEEFGVTHRTIRHYEELALISPERRGTVRIYHRRDRTRLALILRGKRLGFPLEQIRTIIDLYDAPRGRRSQLEYVLLQIGDRRFDLERRREDIEAALRELDEFEQRCITQLQARETYGTKDGSSKRPSERSNTQK